MVVVVEDIVAKEVVENEGVTATLDVVGKVGAEEVVEVGGIDGTNIVGEAQEVVDLECDRRGGGYNVKDPIMEAVRVRRKTMMFPMSGQKPSTLNPKSFTLTSYFSLRLSLHLIRSSYPNSTLLYFLRRSSIAFAPSRRLSGEENAGI
ncbi:hypothetical protein L6452_16680 [Arctium lappa]|uniref:Uncharacterized protein n=1 Tax=Arctium lappa TaxID=4217 RepID=A0ACB9C1M4_ARCLA|nr:hypothetical protein L6452_16680 [Arctium lappa]